MPRRWFPLVCFLIIAAAPPAAAPIEAWIRQLESEDPAVWRAASDRLWYEGPGALPALRRALKHSDPDVVLRAAVVAGKIQWGIRPDTPPAILVQIENYRDGDLARQKAAIDALEKMGSLGLASLKRFLERETSPDLRSHLIARLNQMTIPAARDLIARGELDEAERLLLTNLGGSMDSARAVAAFWWLTGRGEQRAREHEKLAADSPVAARAAALTYRALGDLPSARKIALKADPPVLADILREQEDYKAVLETSWRPGTDAGKAALLWRAGEQARCDEFLARFKSDDHWSRANLFLGTGRPGRSIDALMQASPDAALEILTLMGRIPEALAVAPPSEPKGYASIRLEQAVLAHRMGERELRDKYLGEARHHIEDAILIKKESGDWLLSEKIATGKRIGQRNEALAEVGRLLDRMEPTRLQRGVGLWGDVESSDLRALDYWWRYLHSQSPKEPSKILRRLDGWFVGRKADSEFEAALKDARHGKPENADAADWILAQVRVCEWTSRFDLAEARLKEHIGSDPKMVLALGEFYLRRKRWKEAADTYALALKGDPTQGTTTYWYGLALTKMGGNGKDVIRRARVLILADEGARYQLARALDRLGFEDEAAEEWFILARTSVGGGVYQANAYGVLSRHYERQGKWAEAARSARLMVSAVTLGNAGVFTYTGAYVRLSATEHSNTARDHLHAGRHDEALAAARRTWQDQPEKIELALELVQVLDKAGKFEMANLLVSERLAHLCRACVQTPNAAIRHNQAAWLAVSTRRQLDLALRHARWAVKLAPDAPGFLDTLAEVHFQRGENAEALKVMDRVLALAPDDAYFAAQKKRIAAGDRTAALPKR